MIIYEQARNQRGSRFPATEGGRMTYWMTYLSLFVLGATVTLKLVIG